MSTKPTKKRTKSSSARQDSPGKRQREPVCEHCAAPLFLIISKPSRADLSSTIVPRYIGGANRLRTGGRRVVEEESVAQRLTDEGTRLLVLAKQERRRG